MKKFLWRWLPVVGWMAVIFIGSSVGSVPQVGGRTVDGVIHRAAHLVEFGILGWLVARVVAHGRPITRRELIIALLVTAVYGASDEVHQRFTPGRNSDLVTVLWDVGGGLIGAWLYRRWRRVGRVSRGRTP
jgi:VanZ family protein